jgi:hypothetical protein
VMGRKAAKELVHIRGWLERVDEITQRGKAAYLADALLQEAGDSLMMKLGRPPTGYPGSACSRPTESSGPSPLRTATSSFTSTTRSTAN